MHTDDIQERAGRFAGALKAVYRDLTFSAGEFKTFRSADVSVVIFPGDEEDERGGRWHLISLIRGLVPPGEVQQLPCGVVGGSDLVWVGETDPRGQCRVSLPPGDYRLRYVLDVTDPIDVDILARLDDRSLDPVLDDALEDPAVPSSLKDRITRSRGRAAPSSPLFPAVDTSSLGGAGIWQVPLSVGVSVDFDDDEDDGDELPPDCDVGLTRNGRKFRIRVPVDNAGSVSFKYGAALVESLTEDGRVLGRRLIPVDVDRGGEFYIGETDVAELAPGTETRTGRVCCWEVDDREDILERISVNDVEALLTTPYVKYSVELGRRVAVLLDKLRERQE